KCYVFGDSMQETRYYRHILNKITAAKQAADAMVVDIEHPGLEGDLRELALKNCIEPFLTHSFNVGTGKVIDTYQCLSDQIDALIYHTKLVPPIFFSKELGIYPVESVRYVFEVKSRLNATQLKDSLKKFESIRKLQSFPRKQENGSIEHGKLPATVLFAFGSDISGSEIERYLKYDSYDNPACIALVVLGKGYWFYYDDHKKWYGCDTSNIGDLSEFVMFMTGFMNTLSAEESTMRGFCPGGYVGLDKIAQPVEKT
ncbi:DUF6602 domain-containing protein, partial [Plesiomonas shigelloides]